VPLPIIQSSLSLDELLIECVVSDKESFALAVTRESARSYKIAKSKDLEALVRAYNKEVACPTALSERSRIEAHRLYEAVLGEITEIGRTPRVIVVPDGRLIQSGLTRLWMIAASIWSVRT